MTDQLLSELRKMRSTRTNLGLLAGMIALILLTVLLNGFIPKPHELADSRQPARAALGRHLGGALRRADRRDGDHERVPARHDPPDVRRHAAPEPRDRGEGRREPADGRPLRPRGDRALVRHRLRDPRASRDIPTSRSTRATSLWLVLGTPAMTAAVGGARRRPRRGRPQPGLRRDRPDLWAMVIDNLLRGLVPDRPLHAGRRERRAHRRPRRLCARAGRGRAAPARLRRRVRRRRCPPRRTPRRHLNDDAEHRRHQQAVR